MKNINNSNIRGHWQHQKCCAKNPVICFFEIDSFFPVSRIFLSWWQPSVWLFLFISWLSKWKWGLIFQWSTYSSEVMYSNKIQIKMISVNFFLDRLMSQLENEGIKSKRVKIIVKGIFLVHINYRMSMTKFRLYIFCLRRSFCGSNSCRDIRDNLSNSYRSCSNLWMAQNMVQQLPIHLSCTLWCIDPQKATNCILYKNPFHSNLSDNPTNHGYLCPRPILQMHSHRPKYPFCTRFFHKTYYFPEKH